MIPNNDIALAVRRALFMGAVAATGATTLPSPAQAQTQPAAADEPQQTVVVTGTRLRRVDQETANPVFVLDAAQIRSSGVTSLGDIVQRAPAIAGAATNPQVNNGGGSGDSNVELRGLGAQRTLVLLNGRRVGIVGGIGETTAAVDINMIPINLIERVEVLKEGAGAVYGSDAIAGVVNFITRKEFNGAEANLQYGQTSQHDGKNRLAGLLWGVSSDRGNVMLGGNYNKQDEVSANDRDFSRFALYLYSGVVSKIGSSRTPTGRVNIPGGNPDGTFQQGTLAEQYQCTSLTRIGGTSGRNQGDYRCFQAGIPEVGGDQFNYQPFNLLMTPQERGQLFTESNYNINDTLSAYVEAIYSHTSSRFTIAPLPFDATQDDVVVSSDNFYNPFGIDFGGISAINPNLRSRVEALGNRIGSFTTASMLANAGLKGELGIGDWQWDFNAGYARMDQDRNTQGYLFLPSLRNALGPSLDANTCGSNGVAISGCTPINIFDVTDSTQADLLRSLQSNYHDNLVARTTSYSLNFNGKLIDMPAGDLQAAVGAEWRDQEGATTTDILTRASAPTFLGCQLASETCSGDSFAEYKAKELYAELLVPLLKDLPAVRSLNVNVGVRYSDYSKETIGNKTRGEFKLEWRPINDLLVRGSYAQVFRAPTITDLSLAPAQDAPTFSDPCTGLTSAQLATKHYDQACEHVAPDTGFREPLSQITGLFLGNQDLKPETGHVETAGVVYDSSQIKGLSLTVDFWRYKIQDLITALDVNFSSNACVETGDPKFCDLIFRFDETTAQPGQILVLQEPIVNLGELKTDGVDVGAKYVLNNTSLGSFNFSLDITRINSYENTPAPGAAPIEIAGTYDRQFGNFARYRGLMGVGWKFKGFDGLLTTRYIHKLTVKDADGGAPTTNLEIGSRAYLDLTAGYEFPTDTRVQIGVTNLTDKQPPLLYQNNVINANTDVSTYETLGRRYFIGVTQKF